MTATSRGAPSGTTQSKATTHSSLGHVPTGSWKFDDSVTAVFDDMLQRSIPQYDVMRETVLHIARDFCCPGMLVVDLGASSGEGIAALVEEETSRDREPLARFVAIERSGPMLNELRRRFAASLGPTGVVTVINHDLRRGLPPLNQPVSLVLSILTMQFVPMEYRQQLMQSAYDALAPGGAFVLVEKILGGTAALDELFVRHYLDSKLSNGYSIEEIERKRLSLEGVLVPVTARWNEEMLTHAGFSQIDCFWRWLNFAGWLALKT